MSDRSSRSGRPDDSRRVVRPAGSPVSADTDAADERVAPAPAPRVPRRPVVEPEISADLTEGGVTGWYPVGSFDEDRPTREASLLPDLTRFSEKQLRQQLAYLRREIDFDVPELDGVPADVLQDEIDSRPIPRPVRRDSRRPAARPVRRSLIEPGQDDDVVMEYDMRGNEVGDITVADGLADEYLAPVVDQRGTVMSFVPVDANVARYFKQLTAATDTDGRQVFKVIDRDSRRPAARPERDTRSTRSAEPPAVNRGLLVGVFVILLALIAGPLVWMFVNELFGLTGWASFGMGALFTVFTTFGAALFVTRPRTTNNSRGSRR